jgi:hypothetical protein
VHPYTCPTTRAASPHKPESLLFPFTALELPPLQHLTTIAQKQNKPLKPPKRVNFLPQQKRHTTITITTQTEEKKTRKQKPDSIQQQHCYLLQNIPNFQIK